MRAQNCAITRLRSRLGELCRGRGAWGTTSRPDAGSTPCRRACLLATARVDRARKAALPVQGFHALVEVPGELEHVQHLDKLVVGQGPPATRRLGGGAGRRPRSPLDRSSRGVQGLPASARCASPMPSDRDGWGCIIAATSAGIASQFTISMPSAIRSVTCGPIMCTPRTGPSVSPTTLTNPSPSMFALPIARSRPSRS